MRLSNESRHLSPWAPAAIMLGMSLCATTVAADAVSVADIRPRRERPAKGVLSVQYTAQASVPPVDIRLSLKSSEASTAYIGVTPSGPFASAAGSKIGVFEGELGTATQLSLQSFLQAHESLSRVKSSSMQSPHSVVRQVRIKNGEQTVALSVGEDYAAGEFGEFEKRLAKIVTELVKHHPSRAIRATLATAGDRKQARLVLTLQGIGDKDFLCSFAPFARVMLGLTRPSKKVAGQKTLWLPTNPVEFKGDQLTMTGEPIVNGQVNLKRGKSLTVTTPPIDLSQPTRISARFDFRVVLPEDNGKTRNVSVTADTNTSDASAR